PAGDPCPALSAVAAAPHTVDLHTRPDHAVVRRVDGQRGYPRNADIWALLGHVGAKLLPMLAAVGRSVQSRRPGAGEDDIWVGRVISDLPHMQRIHRRVEPLEMLATILALVDPVIGAGEHGARLIRMGCEPEDAALRPQTRAHLTPALAAIRADPGAGP